ncbi:aspartate dehydrogenase [Caballeronia sp. DA-9]|uniref:aspartate dehydrogenase n=1 Tax=Caballeronia sp. DA-9 TaxID=3436237 RepID=UPI003F67F37E
MNYQRPAGERCRERPARVTLIGFGSIGATVFDALIDDPDIVIDQIITSPRSLEAVRQWVGVTTVVASAADELPRRPDLVLECAGHGAIGDHVVPFLRQGVDCAMVSIGALADEVTRAALRAAQAQGGGHAVPLTGAIGGLDALSAAAVGGLDEVHYIGRKPTEGWRGTPAEATGALDDIRGPKVIFDGEAGAAARLYPKNANVAAAVALAGIGFERTRVQLIADPRATGNTHTVQARGNFGEMRIEIRANPSAQNRKTSALASYSAIRFLRDGLVGRLP